MDLENISVTQLSRCRAQEMTTQTSFDLQPHLKGKLIELRPLTPEDWGDLFSVASDPLIWEQHPESDRYKEDVFKVSSKMRSNLAGICSDRHEEQTNHRIDAIPWVRSAKNLKSRSGGLFLRANIGAGGTTAK